MTHSSPVMERLTDLLAEEATTGVNAERSAEIERLMGEGVGLERDDFMKVAGLVQVGFLHQDRPAQERMPEALRARLPATNSKASSSNRSRTSNCL